MVAAAIVFQVAQLSFRLPNCLSGCPIVFQVAIDALGRAALIVADVLGELVAGLSSGAGLRLGLRLALAARMGSMIGTCPSARLFAQISGAS
jgi:hypothetical protein